MRRTAQLWTLMAALVAAAFALRTLVLIDATALWSDELYSVGKSFQPSPLELLGMLRQDTHPPMYYGLLWVWGQLVGPLAAYAVAPECAPVDRRGMATGPRSG